MYSILNHAPILDFLLRVSQTVTLDQVYGINAIERISQNSAQFTQLNQFNATQGNETTLVHPGPNAPESCPIQSDQRTDLPNHGVSSKVPYIDVWPIDTQPPALPDNVLETMMSKDIAHLLTKG